MKKEFLAAQGAGTLRSAQCVRVEGVQAWTGHDCYGRATASSVVGRARPVWSCEEHRLGRFPDQRRTCNTEVLESSKNYERCEDRQNPQEGSTRMGEPGEGGRESPIMYPARRSDFCAKNMCAQGAERTR